MAKNPGFHVHIFAQNAIAYKAKSRSIPPTRLKTYRILAHAPRALGRRLIDEMVRGFPHPFQGGRLMFSFLTRSPKARLSSLGRRIRPGVECLEARDCPAAPQLSLAATVVSGPAVQLSATVVSGTTVQLSGTVLDDNPATVTITLSGVMSGTTTPTANGSFTFTGQASALGTVQAYAVDNQGLASNVAVVSLISATPVISLTATQNSGTSVTVSGHVTDPSPSGLRVVFGGGASGSTTTNANGDFSVIVDDNTAAAITAMATDAWGQTSNRAAANPGTPPPATSPPTITNFTAIEGTNNTWTISGQVNTGNLQGTTVQLGGLQGLGNNQGTVTVTVNDQGWFSVTVILGSGDDGTATAVATDGSGAVSGMAKTLVRQTQ
jgi:hypothetical protein